MCVNGQIVGKKFEPYLFFYLDDFIIATDSFEKYLETMARLAERWRFANLTISPKKSLFCYKRLKFLGHIIDENGISLDPSRIEAMVNFPEPTCIKDEFWEWLAGIVVSSVISLV